jgi:hypothetical protein
MSSGFFVSGNRPLRAACAGEFRVQCPASDERPKHGGLPARELARQAETELLLFFGLPEEGRNQCGSAGVKTLANEHRTDGLAVEILIWFVNAFFYREAWKPTGYRT